MGEVIFNGADISLDIFSASTDLFNATWNATWIDPLAEAATTGFPYNHIQPDFHIGSYVQPGLGQEMLEDEAGLCLRRAIEQKLHEIGFAEHHEVIHCSQLLFSGNNVAGHMQQYFESWHHSCPVVHEASFDHSTVPWKLLLSMCLIGAAYSTDRAVAIASRKLLDVAELMVFGANIFSLTSAIKSSMRQGDDDTARSTQTDEWNDFQELQAAFLIVEAQFWAGKQSSKRRAIESRYGDLIRV